jgi:hypothetical protein
MKNICFFSRLDLTHLYGGICKHLQNDFQIIHLAYSSFEEDILKSKYGIIEVINFKNEIESILSSLTIDNSKLDEIDKLFIDQSSGRFSLNMAIRLDRSFQFLDYNDCLFLSQAYFTFWDSFINKNNINFLFHEPPAVFMTHVAANLCKKNNAFYLSQSHVPGLHKFNWIMIEGDSGNPIEWNLIKSETEKLEYSKYQCAIEFIDKFRGEYSVLFQELNTITKIQDGYWQFFRSASKLSARRAYNLIAKKKQRQRNKIINHYEKYQDQLQPPYLIDLYNRWYDCFKLKYAQINQDDDYYYYPLHAEPEAAVLYRGDGIYEGQLKLIENIAEQLPPQTLLYVKDHPHRSAFSNRIFYDKLTRIPNVRVINPHIPGRQLIKYATGIFTISGSSGLEAILLNKPVFLFGQAFYSASNRVFKIRNIRDLRAQVYSSRMTYFNDDTELYQFVSLLLSISHEGFMFYFPTHLKKIQINHDLNFEIISKEIKKSLYLLGRQ